MALSNDFTKPDVFPLRTPEEYAEAYRNALNSATHIGGIALQTAIKTSNELGRNYSSLFAKEANLAKMLPACENAKELSHIQQKALQEWWANYMKESGKIYSIGWDNYMKILELLGLHKTFVFSF